MKRFLMLFWLFIFFAGGNLYSSEVNAASSNFSTAYDVTYTVRENGSTRVTFGISLTNTTAQYYASSYKVNLGFDNITNISASDPDGQITPNVSKTESGHEIDLAFNAQVTGLGNSLVFNLSFDTFDIAQKQGRIWEINIPGLSKQDEFSAFNVHVRVPPSFGSPTYIKPSQTTNSLDFAKEALGKSGISIAFGDAQIYSFNLKYRLKNTNLFPVKTEIALPPTTNYQDVFIESIDPAPINVTEDKDGNWLALYYLLPSEKKEIVVKGKTKIALYPKKQILTDIDRGEYLKEKPYWQTTNPKIKELAKTLRTPLAIYEYVIKTLEYDFARVAENKPRLGALGSLENPTSAVCLEFTDLFVALARAAGIPAREVDGFAYTQNEKQRPLSLVKDILHAWPEYYDETLQTWVMVDPTWGNTTGGVDYFTTLDFDHFAFVIKGRNSNYPVPAGGYKLPGDENLKDVEVEFGESLPQSRNNFDLALNMSDTVLSGFPIKGQVILRNKSQILLPSLTASVGIPALYSQKNYLTFQKIPPYGSAVLAFSFEKTPFLTNKNATVTIRVADEELVKTIKISPFILSKQIVLGGVAVALIIAILSIIAVRARRLPFFRQKR
ncbi:MAG: transglutaminase family protein [Candidatus Levybacteria bacterium]|nr:transglutaminase family protein [Candidatus Levybacteria bacterium]